MILVGFFIASVILLLLTVPRFKRKMAAFVAWIIGSITGSEREANEAAATQAVSTASKPTNERSKLLKGIKNKKPKSIPEEPHFNTTLECPIDEIIAEELEEIETQQPSAKNARKRHKASKRPDKTTAKAENKSTKPNNPEDELGYSFFNPKDLPKPEKIPAYSSEKVKSEPHSPVDDLGFSFIPVKEKRLRKSKSAEGQNLLSHETLTKTTKTKSHHEGKQQKDKPTDSFKTFSQTKVGLTLVDNRYKEVKESKKVTSNISYANVAQNLLEKPNNTDEQLGSSYEREEELLNTFVHVKLPVKTNGNTVNNDFLIHERVSQNNQITDHISLTQTKENNCSNKPKTVENCTPNEIESTPTKTEEEKVNKTEVKLPETVETTPKTDHISLEQTEQNNCSNKPETVENCTSNEIESTPAEETKTSVKLAETVETTPKTDALETSDIKQSQEIKMSPVKNAENCPAPSNNKINPNDQVRILILNDNDHKESTIYRLKKNWILQFRFGPSLLGRKISLYCNYPPKMHGYIQDFNRECYQKLDFILDEGCRNADDTALRSQIRVEVAGSFHYYFSYENDENDQVSNGSGYFIVDPVLTYGNDEELPLDCIQCQTILAKNLGSLDTWENKLKVSKESGYNMIHFTPIQKLGASNSAYSLSEQLELNTTFKKANGENNFENIDRLIRKMRTQWKVTTICDIVLNHTANESQWIQSHPEVTYNCANCPYMRPAYLLDAALHQLSKDIQNGDYETMGVPPVITSEDHLNAYRHVVHNKVLSKLKLQELYICDVSKLVVQFLESCRGRVAGNLERELDKKLVLVQDPEFRRLKSSVDMDLALELYNIYRPDCFDEETRIRRCGEDFKQKLDSLNQEKIDKLNGDLNAAVENVIAGIRYFRVQHDGPKIREITLKDPLTSRYFTDVGEPKSIEEFEEIMYGDDCKFLMAHNGWVMNADPLKNFADNSTVYVRRELIAWGDSVKLRFGNGPEDCPYLWNHMRKYVEMTARIFDGVRLDNCHSTPIPVAEYLLDCARKINPNLYVVAELFTNSDHTDNIFVNRLGITSLIREAMSAWDSHEQGRLVYRYGGEPVGSFHQPNIRPIQPSVAHALFLDLTHDNPSPIEKRSVFDLLPSSALVNMACCASGSNRGYDELVPHHIHVVDEAREYTEWSDSENGPKYVSLETGIIKAKKALNNLHYNLGLRGFYQLYVDQIDPDIVAVTRHCPLTHQSYILVAFTAFKHPELGAVNHQRYIKPLCVEGNLDEIVLEASLSHVSSAKEAANKYAQANPHERNNDYINGLNEYMVHVSEHIPLEKSEVFERISAENENMTKLHFKNFKPGSVVVIKVSLNEDHRKAVQEVRGLMQQFSITKNTPLFNVINKMSLADLNRALYRCGQEERDEGFGFDAYNIPNFAPLVYAGFQGFMSLLEVIRPNNDLGHPMCGNLRDGNWMIDYVWQRLKLDEGTLELGNWFETHSESLKKIPRYLVPCYFDLIVTGVYVLLVEHGHNSMSSFVRNGSDFVKSLAMGSIQFDADIKSAKLPTLSPSLSPPLPHMRTSPDGFKRQACVTLSAGLPHFSVGYMRNWGRDTFIALRGMLILTGRYDDARFHILGYAACLRHGLIPNLLDGGNNSRFNCRDAVWWWLYCIKCYTEEAPNGLNILKDKVSRIFPTDDSTAQAPGACDQSLEDVIQEALKIHFQGLIFRERNAGRQIDEHMQDKGFNNQIGVHPETGFVFGGNDANCGTWMDKMGSSDKAGNRGKPATPRDGSACEIVGLSKAVVTWLGELHQMGAYKYNGVVRTHSNGNETKWTFKEWEKKIIDNFEKYFYVNSIPIEGEIKPNLINKRGIYKDCYGATQDWTDFQLRCNFPIVMVVAPELFDPRRAWLALENAEKYLLGPLGMKTLDPEDWGYDGNYDNSNDGTDPKLANGWNYHQGPEWVWPIGFFLRAKLQFAIQNNKLRETIESTKHILSKHYTELKTSEWKGLPELTNTNGAYCKDSSRTQAWSMACVLEVLHDLQRIEAESS